MTPDPWAGRAQEGAVRGARLHRYASIVVALMVGVGLGAGGALALGGSQRSGDSPATVTSYEVVRNDLGQLEIKVWVTTSSNPHFTLWLVEEKPDRVDVAVRERRPGSAGVRTMDAVLTYLSWPLNEPLGDRRVVDVHTGNDVPPLN